MIKLSFKKIMPEDFGRVRTLFEAEDKEKCAVIEQELKEHKLVVIALDDGEGVQAASVLKFEMNDEDYTVPLRRIHLYSLAAAENARENNYDGMMLEYSANTAQDMGYDILTARCDTADTNRLKLLSVHGFGNIIKVDEDEKGAYLKLMRDLKIKIKCCGFYA